MSEIRSMCDKPDSTMGTPTMPMQHILQSGGNGAPIPSGVWTQILRNTSQNSWRDGPTNGRLTRDFGNNQYVVQEDGIYSGAAICRLNNPFVANFDLDRFEIEIRVNGVGVRRQTRARYDDWDMMAGSVAAVNGGVNITIWFSLYLKAGDTVQTWVRQSNKGGLAISQQRQRHYSAIHLGKIGERKDGSTADVVCGDGDSVVASPMQSTFTSHPGGSNNAKRSNNGNQWTESIDEGGNGGGGNLIQWAGGADVRYSTVGGAEGIDIVRSSYDIQGTTNFDMEFAEIQTRGTNPRNHMQKRHCIGDPYNGNGFIPGKMVSGITMRHGPNGNVDGVTTQMNFYSGQVAAGDYGRAMTSILFVETN